MVTKPPIDELTQIAGNKYILCCAVTKRAKQLDQMQANDEISTNVKTISFAAEELYDGKIVLSKE
ncbi:MAG: DNA-directed RNA polymerase subunit omega [Clostridia bacterium]|nr:DNA-directed RNA polymerase subunit omega [Clostridiales bacterium]MBR2303163.1 DNA-directed RNA polymerase subunit omega [Clostridia bacterium]MBR2372191.1 DNA-directed RNA polymerase subunit omega [Clostridia bacterium]